MSGAPRDSRESSGAAKARIEIRTQPRPRATWVSDPPPPTSQALRNVAVGPRAADNPVLAGEADRLLVERRDRDPRVEDLDRVDLVDHREHVLVVGHGVQPVERVRDVDDPTLAADLGDRLLER